MQKLQGLLGILRGVEREGWLVPAVAALVGIRRVLLLKTGRIR
jgi:hypothetical protein